MLSLGLVTGTFGNISCRLGERILITPSGLDYAIMRPEDLVLLEPSGVVVEGPRQPSSEYRLHVAVYRQLPAARAIVHTHSPRAVECGDSLDELPISDGSSLSVPVPVSPLRPPGTQELADGAAELLAKRKANAVILRGHGVVGVGPDLDEVLEVCVEVERLAESLAEPHG